MAKSNARVLSVVLVATACGGGGAPVPTSAGKTSAPKASAAAPPKEVHERVTPHLCPARAKLAALLGQTAPPPSQASEQSAEAAPPPTSLAGGARVASNQAYRAVAPATVLIRTPRGIGTGVVVDPKGYVLTNYHVVADGRKQDFVVTVTVNFGDLTPTGRMRRQEKTYDAVVVKADAIRDLAILKVKEAPAKMASVKLAKSAPQIAERVTAVGHAGIGFLWAAKACSIASIGERQQDTSRLAGFDCNNPDPAMSAAEAERYKKLCDASKKEMTEALMAATQGLAIQTDCSVTFGDSGGPLVNAAGELVGLNQSISAELATASFHVHLDEIRDFIAKYPEEGIAILPDPFCDGGTNTTLEDIDLDGIPDTVLSKGSTGIFGGYDRMSLIIDLEQKHFSKKEGSEGAGTMHGKLALLVLRDTAYVWYDTDDDNRFDVLLVDKENDGHPESAYRIDEAGRAKEDKAALPKHDFSGRFVKDKALHGRLAKIATAVGGSKYVSAKTLAAGSQITTFPDPLVGGGTEGRAIDSDGNRTPDFVAVRGTFSRGVLIDADEDTLASLKSGDAADELVKAKKVDPEVSIVVQGNALWALYDTNNDASFDLALMTTNGSDPSALVATHAWRLAGREMTPASDQMGRKLLRPGLLPAFPRVAGALRVVGADVATDEGAGSLPDPMLSRRARFRARELKGFGPSTIVEAQVWGASTVLVDVDHDTKLSFAAKEDDVHKIVSEGKFDAEVAVVHRSGSDWIFYDTDNDAKFDLVLFVATTGRDPAQAYRLGAGKLEVDAAVVAGKPLRHSVFKDKVMAAKWKAIAAKTFKASSLEE